MNRPLLWIAITSAVLCLLSVVAGRHPAQAKDTVRPLRMRIESPTPHGALFTVDDERNGVVCYAIESNPDDRGRIHEAISCVKVR